MRLGISTLYGGLPTGTPILVQHDHTRLCIWRDGPTYAYSWAGICKSGPTPDWTALDQCLARLLPGRSVIYQLGQVPQWAIKRPFTADEIKQGYALAGPIDQAAWSEWCKAVATRYRGRFDYEIANEPGAWLRDPAGPAEMVEMTRLAHEVIHAIDPGARVMNAPLSNIAGGALALYEKMFSARDTKGTRLADYIDAVSTHTYGDEASGSLKSWVADFMPAFRSMLAANGCGDLPIWSTESGHRNTPSLTPEQAAQWVRMTVQMHRDLGFAALTYFAWDSANCGIYKSRGACRAWQALQ